MPDRGNRPVREGNAPGGDPRCKLSSARGVIALNHRRIQRRFFVIVRPETNGDVDPARSFTIRTLGAADAGLMEALATTFAEAFGDPQTYCGARPSPAYLRRLLGRESFIALVALEAGEVIGGLAAYDLTKFEQERSEIYIYDLAVAAAHRRQGIATALIAKLKEIARARGAWVIFVQADLDDAPAIALYTKLGTREDVLHFDIPPGS